MAACSGWAFSHLACLLAVPSSNKPTVNVRWFRQHTTMDGSEWWRAKLAIIFNETNTVSWSISVPCTLLKKFLGAFYFFSHARIACAATFCMMLGDRQGRLQCYYPKDTPVKHFGPNHKHIYYLLLYCTFSFWPSHQSCRLLSSNRSIKSFNTSAATEQ